MQVTRRTLFGASAVSVLALAGCAQADESTEGGGGSTGASTGGAGGGGEAVGADENDINAMPREEMGEGGTLRLANNAYPANWNTFHSDGNEGNTVEISETVAPVLFVSSPSAEVEANPHYTARLELVSEDPQIMEVELLPDMQWSDGTPIDYTSIENVFATMDGSKPDYGISSSEGYDKVETVEQGDNALTARITFAEKYADWIGLAAVMPDSLVASADAFNSGWIEAPQVTAGPFKIGELDPANKTVLVVPDENWWGDTPLLEQILWTTIEDPAAAATSFQNGQLDRIETSVPATWAVVEPMIGEGVSLRTAAGPDWTHLTLNGAEGRPLADQRVRQAFFKALDREEIFLSVNAAMPYPEGAGQLNNHLLMSNQEGYQDNSGDLGAQDVEGARALLEEAGYTIEGEQAMKDGAPLELTYVYNDGSKTNEAVVPVVQAALQEIGITMNVQMVPPTDLFSQYVIPGEFDVTLFGWLGTPFLSSGDAIWKSDGEQNFGKVGSPEVDELIDAAAVETDPDARLDLINEIDAGLWELAGTLPLWQAYTFSVQHDDLANYGAFGFQSEDWTAVGYVADSDKLNA